MLFAFCPPTEYGGGWVCFSVAIMMIGMLTAVIGELAGGCVGCVGARASEWVSEWVRGCAGEWVCECVSE